MTKVFALTKQTSLESFFHKQALRWAIVGFVLTTFFAVPCVLYSAKVSSERQLLATAKSAARAFRPMILQDNIRDAQFQMQKALELKPEESAIIRDPKLNPIYPMRESDQRPRCTKPNQYCWEKGFHSVSLLYPIYFDADKNEDLFGYLELSLKPTIDRNVVSILLFLLLAAFICQAFGLSSALSQSSEQITKQLSRWSTHLREKPESRMTDSIEVPFSDLKSMQDAVDGLYMEIAKLREKTAQEAKTEAQFALLREISHDLKTPHSLLARYFALHIDTLEQTGKMDPVEVLKVQRTLKRMGELIRQVKVFPISQSATLKKNASESNFCYLENETSVVLEDLNSDPEVLEKKIQIKAKISSDMPLAIIAPIAYYRILENLVRNAIEAVGKNGRILVSVEMFENKPTLIVQDNGCGIESEIRKKIFAFDFTTKASRGTGLGLGIVDRICKEFNASLRLKSTVGVGTTFTVQFQTAEATFAHVISNEVTYGQV